MNMDMLCRLWLTMLLATTVSGVYACDGCSANLSIFNSELQLNSGRHSIGVQDQTRFFSATLHESMMDYLKGPNKTDDGHVHTEPQVETPYRQIQTTTDIRGTYYLRPKWSLMAIVPVTTKLLYSDDNQYRDGRKLEQHQGLGDVVLVAQYQALTEGRRLVARKLQQRLVVGAGIKLPTGKYKEMGYDGLLRPDLQNGSGSVDFIATTNYIVRSKSWGATAMVSYKINTANKLGYRFANSLNVDVRGFWFKEFKRVAIAPSTGVWVEQAGANQITAATPEGPTGGLFLFGTVGFDLFKGNWGLNCLWRHPLAQQIAVNEQFGNVSGFQVGAKYAFDSKRLTKSTTTQNKQKI
ncbi:hypothetical protein BH09BAC1_BH09BAC1_17600 [soil metagenome]